MKFLDNRIKKLNPIQKIIVAVVGALILLVLCLSIADSQGFSRNGANAFDWNNTWYIWAIFLFLTGYFEYKLFQDSTDESQE